MAISRGEKSRRRRGAMLLQLALLLFALLTFVSLAVDVGIFYAQQTELQAAADAAALAAALELPNTSAGLSAASSVAEANLPASVHGAVYSSSDVVFGRWDRATRVFAPNATPYNAARVTLRKSASSGNAVPWLVGSLFGLASVDLTAQATSERLPDIPGGLVAGGSIEMRGSTSIDSYDSTQGAYNPNTAGGFGDIVTSGPLLISGSSTVDGNAIGGPVFTVGSADVTGTSSAPRRPLDLPSVDTTDAELSNDNNQLPLIQQGKNLVSPLDANGDFTLSSGVEYDMPAGVYLFRNLSLNGQALLRTSGAVTIYLTGDLDTSGGDVVNSTADPNTLQILMTGGDATINAGVDWYGLLYAPDSEVTLSGTAEIYGAIVGEFVDFSGSSSLHYDLGLSFGGDLAGELVRRSNLVD